jgi:uncharacterized protein
MGSPSQALVRKAKTVRASIRAVTDPAPLRTLCWKPRWNLQEPDTGMEQLLLSAASARSVLLAFDEDGQPFCLRYELQWDEAWQLRSADLQVESAAGTRSLLLRTDGEGHWRDGLDQPLADLDGCIDIDIWPTPFTNCFPLRRLPLAIGERREYRMAWVSAPELILKPQPQAYTRLADRRYCFENLDGSGFKVELPVDDEDIVLDYPGYFERIRPAS